VLAAGCGGGGPARYSLEGSVTLGGVPVPAGEIAFEPDDARGNTGPGSVARIRNGRYQTEPGLGVVGGAYLVRIIPMTGTPAGDSEDGRPLLRAPHVEAVELPAGEATRDFDIPARKVPGG
jgi:hypothetical protein